MNFRVALQYEFTNLELDLCLDRLKNHESDELAVQVSRPLTGRFTSVFRIRIRIRMDPYHLVGSGSVSGNH